MTGKQKNKLSLLAFLLASSVISGCNDDGTSISEFGTGASLGSSGTSSISTVNVDPTFTLASDALNTGEYLSGSVLFGLDSYVWTDARVTSGPAVEMYFLDKANAEEWDDAVENRSLESFVFTSPIPALEGQLDGEHKTPPIFVEAGAYTLVVENTVAGNIRPEDGADPTALVASLFVETSRQYGPTEVRVISLSKVRVSGQRHQAD